MDCDGIHSHRFYDECISVIQQGDYHSLLVQCISVFYFFFPLTAYLMQTELFSEHYFHHVHVEK